MSAFACVSLWSTLECGGAQWGKRERATKGKRRSREIDDGWRCERKAAKAVAGVNTGARMCICVCV